MLLLEYVMTCGPSTLVGNVTNMCFRLWLLPRERVQNVIYITIDSSVPHRIFKQATQLIPFTFQFLIQTRCQHEHTFYTQSVYRAKRNKRISRLVTYSEELYPPPNHQYAPNGTRGQPDQRAGRREQQGSV